MEKMFEKNNMFGDDIARMERYDFSRANLNEENRVYAITKVASICYQNPKALNSDALYNRLMAESIGLPSSSFEFIPILIPWVRLHDMVHWEKGYDFTTLNMVKYGMWITVDGDKALITNYRALVYDVSAEKIPEQYLKYFNTEEECDIIKEYIFTFLFKIDLNTRSQMVRHRSQFQEISRRYVSGNRVPFTFYISDKMKNVRATISRDVLTESISDTDDMDNMTGGSFVSNKATFSIGAQDLIDMSLSLYEQSLKAGVKPEEARRFIPQAAYTDIWMSMNKDQLDNYLKLRLCKTAQWEIRQTAIAITESIGMEGKYEQ